MLTDVAVDTALPYLLTDADGAPMVPDAAPTFRVIGAAGEVGGGTLTAAETGAITGVTAATPPIVTSAGHGLVTGSVVTVAGVGGLSGVNGTRTVTVLSANTFSLDGATGVGAYTSGGSWATTGLYLIPIDAPLQAALEPGRTYLVAVYGKLSNVSFARSFHVTVA